MLKNLTNSMKDFRKYSILYAVGNADVLTQMQVIPALEPFSDNIIELLNDISKQLLSDREVRAYPDIVTLAFWMRRASIEQLKKRFVNKEEEVYKIGRGIVFHITPSNVPVNYAYSLVTGLLCGNANIVRIPSKEFPQVTIINKAITKVLREHKTMIPYISLIKYKHDSLINDALSDIADVRVIWGGDNTIEELRKSVIKPRTTEITFADRYSLVVIDSDVYIEIENKVKVANDFYNDTYLTDQNACTSPRVVVWMGSKKDEAKKIFWKELYKFAEPKYEIQGVQAVNKLTSGYLLAAIKEQIKRMDYKDNLIVRMQVKEITANLMELKDNSGYFLEYDCNDILELCDLCNDTRCQTISYIGNKNMFLPLIKSGRKGMDRIVPMGKTMDFDLIWDGYNLFERLTRSIVIQ